MSSLENSYISINLLIKCLLKCYNGFYYILNTYTLIDQFWLTQSQDKTYNWYIYHYKAHQKDYQQDLIMSLT